MKLKKIVLATHNQGKIRELKKYIEEYGFQVEALPENFPSIEENGTSFEENALIKARAAADILHLPAIADDSGLEVDALNGAPGIYSARFSDDIEALPGESTDARNNRKLLSLLNDFTLEKRTARYRCCIALVYPEEENKPDDFVVFGTWEGLILNEYRGKNGFGYDPIFLDTEVQLTGGEMSTEFKMTRSHRGKALAKLQEEFRKRYNCPKK